MDNKSNDIKGRRGYLDREVPSTFIDEWTEKYSQSENEDNLPELSFVVFRIDKQLFALETKFFVESFPILDVHSVPLRTNDFFLGLSNVNGELIFVINLCEILKYDSSPIDNLGSKDLMLLLDSDDIKFIISVKDIIGEIRVKKDNIESLPDNIVQAHINTLISRFVLNSESVLIINDKVIFKLIDSRLTQ